MDLLKSKILPIFSKAKKSLADFGSKSARILFIRKKNQPSVPGADLDKKLVYSLSRSKIPSWQQLKYWKKVLSRKEAWTIRFFSFLIVASFIFGGVNFYLKHLVEVPVAGGDYVEGSVGGPQHVNPLYAGANDVDNDLVRLVFSSLFKFDVNGEIQPDLVEKYEISEDGKTYVLKIKDNVRWHHDGRLTADDVVFTFEAIKNRLYASPLRANFTEVEIEKKDDLTVAFILKEKYAPFLSLLTFGILPSGLWGQVPPESAALAELNLKPIGSGPYEFKSLIKDKDGGIKSYNLVINKDYYGDKALIKNLTFRFYSSAEEAVRALNANEISGLSYLPKENEGDLIARQSLNIYKLNLPQIKAVFFNPEKNKALKDIKVRQALSRTVPREHIADDILGGRARASYGPLPESNFAFNPSTAKNEFDEAKAAAILAEAGWKKEVISEEDVAKLVNKRDNPTSSKAVLTDEEKAKLELGAGEWLSKEELIDKKKKETKKTFFALSLTAIDDEENRQIADILKTNWEKLGVKVKTEFAPGNEIQGEIVKPKNYEALIFKESLGADPDVYVFWHSSQSGEGGLNLSNYKNEEADRMLEEGRLVSSREERIAKYGKFQEIIAQEAPAAFFYSPYYVYVQSRKIKNFSVKNIISPSDRFTDANRWYVKTGRRLKW